METQKKYQWWISIRANGRIVMNKQPKNPFHAGEILLEEFLIPMEETHELIKGKRGITADTAIDWAEVSDGNSSL